MSNRIFSRKIIRILGIILILFGIPLTTLVIKNQTVFKGSASSSEEPQNIKITNISDKSFTISYQTNIATTGSVSYGIDKKLGESELDDADKEKESFSPKKIHNITLKNLKPDTEYFLTVASGPKTFLDNGAPFGIITGPNIASPSAQEENIVKGKIVLPDGNAPSEAIVYLSAENSQVLSTATEKDGTFSFSLENLRTKDLSSYFDINDEAVFNIVATDGLLQATASASLSKTKIIPTMTLSNNYDFSEKDTFAATKSAKPSAGFPPVVPTSSLSSKKEIKIEILSPKENQLSVNQKPQFRGTSLPNEKIEIIIHSAEEIITQITADKNGNWTYKPTADLSPGIHTITIKTRDSSGILKTIVKSFTVYAADSPAITVAPSAMPTQQIMPTSIPVLLESIIPTIAPSTIPTPTFTPIFAPSQTNEPIGLKGGLPPTGDSQTIFMSIIAIATTTAGIVLFLLSQKMPL
jgi:hypothetical protein